MADSNEMSRLWNPISKHGQSWNGNTMSMRPHETCGEWEALILLQRTVRRRRCGKNKIRLYRTSFRGGLEEVGLGVMLSARAWTVRWTWPTGGVGGCFVVRAEAEMSTDVAMKEWVKGQYVYDKLHSSADAAEGGETGKY
jgi:hypothetical protein